MKQPMTATKAFRYSTRNMVAGDEFEASRTDARVLAAIGKAEYRVEAPADPLDDLRAEAEALGVEVDNRWGAPRLMREIKKASEQE